MSTKLISKITDQYLSHTNGLNRWLNRKNEKFEIYFKNGVSDIYFVLLEMESLIEIDSNCYVIAIPKSWMDNKKISNERDLWGVVGSAPLMKLSEFEKIYTKVTEDKQIEEMHLKNEEFLRVKKLKEEGHNLKTYL